MYASSTATPLPSHTDFLELRYRADLHLLVGRWQRPVSAAEFRQGYQAILRAAQEVNCPYWQLDVRGRQPLDAPTSQWLMDEFIPQLSTQLSGAVCLAYMMSPRHLAQERALPAASLGIRVAFFAEEGPLTAWLTQCQHRSRAALVQAGFTPPPAV